MEDEYYTEDCFQYALNKYTQNKQDCKILSVMALMYEHANNHIDIPRAIKYYKKAIKRGETDSIRNLASLYVDDHQYRNIPKAIKYYKKSIKRGDSDAMNELGYLYSYQENYIDIPKAIKYYKKAIRRSNSSAMYNLGYLYATEKNYIDVQKAVKYYEMAIINGDDSYAELLHKLLSQNSKDYVVKYVHLKKSNEELKKRVEELETELKYQPGGVGYIEAKTHFEQSIGLSNT
jgi:TPR repeat protein